MRVLFATDSIRAPVRGAGRLALGLVRELTALGAEVTPLDTACNPRAEEAAGRATCVLPPRLPWLRTPLWHLTLLRRVARSAPPHDVLVDPSGYPSVVGRHPAFVQHVLDLSALRPGSYSRGKHLWFRAFYGAGLRRARLLVCISDRTRRDLLARFPGLDAARCRVAHLGVGTGLRAARSGEGGHLLFVGTLERRKNVARLLDAYALARQRGATPPLVLAGRPGDGGSEILARAAAPDLRDHVRIAGGVPDEELAQLYADALAVLLPSLDEGFGLPVVEAMQAGAPVLTSTAGALPEVAGDAALLVDPLDTEAIAEGIVRLAGDAALRSELAARGAERARAFEPRAKAAEFLALLEEASATARAGAGGR